MRDPNGCGSRNACDGGALLFDSSPYGIWSSGVGTLFGCVNQDVHVIVLKSRYDHDSTGFAGGRLVTAAAISPGCAGIALLLEAIFLDLITVAGSCYRVSVSFTFFLTGIKFDSSIHLW